MIEATKTNEVCPLQGFEPVILRMTMPICKSLAACLQFLIYLGWSAGSGDRWRYRPIAAELITKKNCIRVGLKSERVPNALDHMKRFLRGGVRPGGVLPQSRKLQRDVQKERGIIAKIAPPQMPGVLQESMQPLEA